jgi:hypothetical protein
MTEPTRSRDTRQLAESALVRLIDAYGEVPGFVLLGGLVPDLLCARSSTSHVGTTDVDVQVDLEIASGSANATRLEAALRTAGFEPESARSWRWLDRSAPSLVVKAEFLADLVDVPNQTTLTFDGCDHLGAVNLRGTGFAARDYQIRQIKSAHAADSSVTGLRVAGLAGYLLAKTHAAHRRRATKDWYDVAFVLIHNDDGGPRPAARAVLDKFADALVGETRTALDDLESNFASTAAQGAIAFAESTLEIHPDRDWDILANDAVTAVATFVKELALS